MEADLLNLGKDFHHKTNLFTGTKKQLFQLNLFIMRELQGTPLRKTAWRSTGLLSTVSRILTCSRRKPLGGAQPSHKACRPTLVFTPNLPNAHTITPNPPNHTITPNVPKEASALSLVSSLKQATGETNLALVGGVALNSVMNGRLIKYAIVLSMQYFKCLCI